MSRVTQVLEKLGVEYQERGTRAWAARCPLPTHGTHNEAHRFQNFFIRTDRGAWSGYHCFSCKSGGNLVELVMLLRGVDFASALEWVRGIAGAETEAPILSVRTEVARPPGAIALPDGVVRMGAPLEEWNSVPRAYAEDRGITDDQVKRWRLGYALEGRLAGRLFLPIFDRRGRLANYAARTFVGDEKRYLAAGSWEKPDKNVLFGEHRWPEKKDRDVVFVVEGALNGLAIERGLRYSGIYLAYLTPANVEVGGMSGLDEGEGGDVDPRTLMKLATFRRVVVATDPDGPGDRAARAIAHALRKQTSVGRLGLPRGKDASDLWREDPRELYSRLADAMASPRGN